MIRFQAYIRFPIRKYFNSNIYKAIETGGVFCYTVDKENRKERLV